MNQTSQNPTLQITNSNVIIAIEYKHISHFPKLALPIPGFHCFYAVEEKHYVYFVKTLYLMEGKTYYSLFDSIPLGHYLFICLFIY